MWKVICYGSDTKSLKHNTIAGKSWQSKRKRNKQKEILICRDPVHIHDYLTLRGKAGPEEIYDCSF